MKKILRILMVVTAALALCLSTASAQLMKTEGAAGTVTELYTSPASNAQTAGYVASGDLIDVIDASADHGWFQVEAEGDLLWIPSTAVRAALPSDLYRFPTLEGNLYMTAAETTDVYKSRIDQIASMSIEVIPDKRAADVIASYEERLPGGKELSFSLEGRSAPGYVLEQGLISLTWIAVDLNGGDTLCFEMIGSSDPEDDTMAFFLEAIDDIHFTDTVGELSRANRIRCPRCGEWFDSPESYSAHACSKALVRNTEQTVNYVQCPDCGGWFEEGNIFRNHVCPARSDFVQCPDCGKWYEAGNVFRNHVCPAKDYRYVQCPDCGDWFEEGNIFRNHVCPAKDYDTGAEAELVQCPDCGGWFEEGVIFRNHNCPGKETFSQEDSELVQCPDCGGWFEEGAIFRNHNCPGKETYSQEDSELVQCPDCGGWFEEGTIFRNHYCPAKEDPEDGYSQDSSAPEQPGEAVDSFTQDDLAPEQPGEAVDSFTQDDLAPEQPEEAIESYSQDPQAYDPYDDEPVESGYQDPDA